MEICLKNHLFSHALNMPILAKNGTLLGAKMHAFVPKKHFLKFSMTFNSEKKTEIRISCHRYTLVNNQQENI